MKKQAEDLLAKVKGGADFAELATKFSEDDSSKVKGGDWAFSAGPMVPEFDKVAFSLAPGQISDLVKSQFGYHIIKVIEKKPATKRTLDEVPRADRRSAQDAARPGGGAADSEGSRRQGEKPEDLDNVAKPRGFTVGETAFFARNEPVPGPRHVARSRLTRVRLKDKEVSEACSPPRAMHSSRSPGSRTRRRRRWTR